MALKKLLNSHEAQTKILLGAAAQKNAAEVFSKVRMADVLPIEGSGIDDDSYRFALQAHFDFVVVDRDHAPLFAVEYDGPGHAGVGSVERDRKKNFLCARFDLPLARVCDEHIFRKIRDLDYVTWFTEVFFAFQAVEEAREKGIFPDDEPFDPMAFVSIPSVKGRFPLWLSADARMRLLSLRKDKSVLKSYPVEIGAYPADPDSYEGGCLVMASTPTDGMLMSLSAIYIRGFGVAPSEVANEISIVNFVSFLEEYRGTGINALSPEGVRDVLIRFLRQYPVLGHMSGEFSGGTMPFSLGWNGTVWRVAAFQGEPEVLIPIPPRRGA